MRRAGKQPILEPAEQRRLDLHCTVGHLVQMEEEEGVRVSVSVSVSVSDV